MHALRGRYRRSKKASSNPYAGRGLDKFALVSAELEAKRERLAAQLGTPLSVVRFAIGSHRTWIPIIISSSSRTDIQALRRAAEALISEDQPAWDAGIIGDKPALGGLISEGKTHLGGLKSDLGDNIITNPGGEHKAANEGETKVYQREKMGFLVAATAGVLWVAKAVALGIKMAAIIASNVVMLHWHAKAMVKSLPSAQRANLPKEESATTIAHSSAAMASPTPSSSSFAFSQSGMASSSSSLQASHLPFRSSPAPVRIKSKNALSDQVAREGSPHAHMEIEEDRLGQKVNSHKLLRSSTSMMVREMASEKVKKERSEKLGQALSAAGLILGLSGLVIGYVPAILGVVCWWYVLPSLRKAAGDKPSVRSHHHHHHNSHNNSNNNNILHTNTKSNNNILHTKTLHTKRKKVITVIGSGKSMT